MSEEHKVATAAEIVLPARDESNAFENYIEQPPDAPLSAEDQAKMVELRKAVEHVFKTIPENDRAYWSSDHALNRFLVARNKTVAAAAKMYEHTIAFRLSRSCHRLLDPGFYREPQVLRRYFPTGFVGRDREGFPVLVERVGNIDLVGMHAAVGTEEFLNWVCFYHEVQEKMMRGVSAAEGKNRHKMTCIIDMQNLSLRHLNSATLNVLKSRTRLEEENYPEVVKRVLLINTPSMFASVWGIVKLFMDAGTVNKLQILSSDYLPTLLKFIDEDNIPAYLGGKLKDPHGDPECKSMVSPGGVIPHSLVAGIGDDNRGAGEEVAIAAGRCSDLLLHLPPGATLRWHFASVGNDIGFGVCAAPAAAAVPTDAAAAYKATGVIAISRSVYGAHICAPGFADDGHPPAKVTANTSPTDASKPLPGSAPGSKVEEVVPHTRVAKGQASYNVPAADVGDAAASAHGQVVRLRWDNSYSWMSGKTVVRRVDVLLPATDSSSAALQAADIDDKLARDREAHCAALMAALAAAK